MCCLITIFPRGICVMCYKILIIYMVLAESIAYYDREYRKNQIGGKPQRKHLNWTFKDYLKKYDPRTVWDKIDKMKKKGIKLTVKQEIDIFIKGIDTSDDFLRVKVEDGDAKLLVMKDGRRWQPPPGMTDFPKDRFSLRRRLFELMKQAIYQARNRMVIMQELRDKYREESLYKMGYLMSKTDNACKTFSKVAFRAFRACILGRQSVMYRHRIYEILASEERVLNLWFTVELLVDLIRKNDNYLKDMLANGTVHPKKEWIFTDS